MEDYTGDKFYVTLDPDGDREGPKHETKAQAVAWARTNINEFYNKKAYVAEVIARVTPAPNPTLVLDL